MNKAEHLPQINIVVSLEAQEINSDTPKELIIAQECWTQMSAILQVLAMVGENEGMFVEINPFWAIRTLALLGERFNDIAFNNLDKFLLVYKPEDKTDA